MPFLALFSGCPYPVLSAGLGSGLSFVFVGTVFVADVFGAMVACFVVELGVAFPA